MMKKKPEKTQMISCSFLRILNPKKYEDET